MSSDASNSPRSTTFLVGAGLSKAMAPSMPLLAQLDMPALPAELAGLGKLDIESAFTLLHDRQPWRDAGRDLQAQSLAWQWRKDIASQVAEDQDRATEDPAWEQTANGWGHQWIERCNKENAAIVSLNYDVLIERLASQAALPRHSRVRDAEMTFPWGIYPITMPLPRSTVPSGVLDGRTGLSLIKLHGSINWLQDPRDPNVLIASDLHIFSKEADVKYRQFLAEEFPALHAFVVPPVLTKPVSSFGTRYLDLWQHGANKTRQDRPSHCARLLAPTQRCSAPRLDRREPS